MCVCVCERERERERERRERERERERETAKLRKNEELLRKKNIKGLVKQWVFFILTKCIPKPTKDVELF